MARRLAAAGCLAPGAEAEELVRAAGGALGGEPAARLDAMLRRRELGEPLAWITGTTWFCGRRVAVDPGVFVPRPQTEELARRAAADLPEGGRSVDLCCGSGAVGSHLAASVPGAAVVALDVDARAVACARRNGLAAVRADLRARPVEVPLRPASFDVVTAIAPYVPTDALRLLPSDVRHHEPLHALDGGSDGLRLVTRVVEAAAGLLVPGGSLLVEVGGDQEAAVVELTVAAGLGAVTPWHDEDGDLRGVRAVQAS